jgi:hypothetical protein
LGFGNYRELKEKKMSNPTTPFSWQMPTSTDLVTDLPADFEVFGQAVATSMADLLGGTTGQILSKTSNTDMDFTWVAPTSGDITGVTAGTGISGGGTSGDVTVTNSMATALTTKGDLTPATGSAAFARLGVGANNTVLTADSTAATGIKWAAVAASPASANSTVATQETTTSGSYAALTTAQAVTITTGTKVLVLLSAWTTANNSGNQYMSVAVSGATTIAASDANSMFTAISSSISDDNQKLGIALYLTVTAGSNTFTAQFKQSGGNAKFQNRQITVIDLGS